VRASCPLDMYLITPGSAVTFPKGQLSGGKKEKVKSPLPPAPLPYT